MVQFSRIRDDLKVSWYFRIWFGLWIICFLMGWVVLGMFSTFSSEADEHDYIQKWEESVNEIVFPDFHIRFKLSPGQAVLYSNCTINSGQTVVPTQMGICIYNDSCLHVQNEKNNIKACATWSNACDNRLVCNLTLTNVSTFVDQLVAWELDDTDEQATGDNSYSSLWIANNNNAWVMLTKEYDVEDDEEWERSLLYHSTKAIDNQWIITTLINSFDVIHESTEDSFYNGWVAVADIGGFFFFLYLLHSVVMILFGFCLPKNSTFLYPDTKPYEDLH